MPSNKLPISSDIPKGLLSASAAVSLVDNPTTVASNFLQRWGEYTPHNLQKVLQTEEANQQDKMLALFALGYLHESEAADILLPYLQLEKRSERWISAVSLGRHKHEAVFTLLQDMLLEDLLDFDFTSDDVRHGEKDWYLMRCLDIVFVLGDWGNATAIPALHKAFELCLEHEKQTTSASSALIPSAWQPLQKGLAYALGQLGAWGVLSPLQISLPQWNIASLYLILGSLQAITPDYELTDHRWNWIYKQPIVKQRNGTLTASFIGLDQIRWALQERFGFSREEQDAYFQQIWETDPRYEFVRPSQRK